MSYGVIPSGFVPKTLPTIKAEIEASLRATFGPGVNLLPQSNLGQLVGILAEREAEVWQLAEGVYHAATPDGAAGVALDLVAALTGTVRKPPSLSRVYATITGTGGTVLPAGRVVSVSGTGARFVTASPVTIPVGGTLAGVEFVAEESGPTPVYAGTLTQIETPVAGWATVTNPEDHHKLGSDLETDSALRVRREVELRSQGNAGLNPIRARVLALPNVTECIVFENSTDNTDGSGLPPHSFEVLVDGGDDATIRGAIFSAKAAGISTHGNLTGTVADSAGDSHTIKFSRPETLDVYLAIDVTIDPATFPADGDAQIAQALVDYGDARFRVGADVVAAPLLAQVFKVSGVLDATPIKIGTVPAPTSTANLVVATRELAKLDTSRITVAHV